IFAVGLSATDIIGHTYGADSQEVMDQLLRLDLTIAQLFEEIHKRVGLDNTWVVLSADHGSLPLVENLKEKGLDARRVRSSEINATVTQALNARFPGIKGLIANYDPPNFYLDQEVIEKNHLKRTLVENTVKDALEATGVFESVY